MDLDKEAFVVYIASLSVGFRIAIYLARKVQIGVLDIKKVIVSSEYSDYTNVFSKASAVEVYKHTSINDHLIDLIDGKQPLYGPIYSLGLVELKMLKTYIETNLTNNFIQLSQLLGDALILFIKIKDDSF